MKTMKRLGCLLALVLFAGATAQAASWFDGVVQEYLTEVTVGAWTNTEGWHWNSDAKTGALTNWNARIPLKYTPFVPQGTKDEAISTTVKFSTMDEADLLDAVSLNGVKGGLTVAQPDGGTAAYYGVARVNGVMGWKVLYGAQPDGDKYVEVTVEFIEKGADKFVNYKVDGTLLSLDSYGTETDIPVQIEDTQITSIEYLGQCNIATLAGKIWNADPTVPDVIDVAGGPTGGMKYNHAELREYIGADADDDNKVKAFFEKDCLNGLKGWVNYSLGLAETDVFGVESNKCVAGAVTLDFGFAVAEGHAVTYKMDDAKDASNEATVSTSGKTKADNTKIHTVEVFVDGISVSNEVFGVMDTGKDTPGKETGDKTFDIVAVPWESFGGGDVTVANLLNTAELTKGDTLYVWNVAGYYDTYTLKEKGGAWERKKVTVIDTTGNSLDTELEPEAKHLPQGTAIWIERDVSSRLIFAGKLAKDATDPSAEKENIVEAAAGDWTLIANPTVNALTLCTIQANKDDQIVVEDVNDPREYVFNGTKWSYTTWEEKPGLRGRMIKVAKTITDGDNGEVFEIPAGVGFWYVNAGTKAVTINFGTNVPAKQ